MRKTTLYELSLLPRYTASLQSCKLSCVFFVLVFTSLLRLRACEALGLLVPLDFDIAAFTSAAYQRGSLPRPSMEISSWSRLRA